MNLAFSRKITYFYGPFSSQPCLMTPEGKPFLMARNQAEGASYAAEQLTKQQRNSSRPASGVRKVAKAGKGGRDMEKPP